jgi:hypothetical protein
VSLARTDGRPVGAAPARPPRQREAASDHLMANDPTSPLVNYLAFNLRRQEQAAAGG